MNQEKIPYGRQAILPILIFVVALIGFYYFKDYVLDRMTFNKTTANTLVFFVLYLGAQLVAALIDFVTRRYSFSLKNFFILWGSYLWMTFINLLFIVLAIPLLLFQFLMGPVAIIGGFIAIATLFIFFVQEVLGFQMVPNPPDRQLALYALLFVLFFVGLYALLFRLNAGLGYITDKFVDFFYEKISEPAARFNRSILILMDI